MKQQSTGSNPQAAIHRQQQSTGKCEHHTHNKQRRIRHTSLCPKVDTTMKSIREEDGGWKVGATTWHPAIAGTRAGHAPFVIRTASKELPHTQSPQATATAAAAAAGQVSFSGTDRFNSAVHSPCCEPLTQRVRTAPAPRNYIREESLRLYAGEHSISIKGRISPRAPTAFSLSTFGIASLSWQLANEASAADSIVSASWLSVNNPPASLRSSVSMLSEQLEAQADPQGVTAACSQLPATDCDSPVKRTEQHRDAHPEVGGVPESNASWFPSCGQAGCSCSSSLYDLSAPVRGAKDTVQPRPSLAEVWVMVSSDPAERKPASTTGEVAEVPPEMHSKSGPSVSPFQTIASKDLLSGLVSMQPVQ